MSLRLLLLPTPGRGFDAYLLPEGKDNTTGEYMWPSTNHLQLEQHISLFETDQHLFQ